MLTGEADGYRIRLTAEQAGKINPLRKTPVDTLIKWERIQSSHDGNYHLCLAIASNFNVSRSMIGSIANGKRWAHV
jgi:hypothetical protein